MCLLAQASDRTVTLGQSNADKTNSCKVLFAKIKSVPGCAVDGHVPGSSPSEDSASVGKASRGREIALPSIEKDSPEPKKKVTAPRSKKIGNAALKKVTAAPPKSPARRKYSGKSAKLTVSKKSVVIEILDSSDEDVKNKDDAADDDDDDDAAAADTDNDEDNDAAAADTDDDEDDEDDDEDKDKDDEDDAADTDDDDDDQDNSEDESMEDAEKNDGKLPLLSHL